MEGVGGRRRRVLLVRRVHVDVERRLSAQDGRGCLRGDHRARRQVPATVAGSYGEVLCTRSAGPPSRIARQLVELLGQRGAERRLQPVETVVRGLVGVAGPAGGEGEPLAVAVAAGRHGDGRQGQAVGVVPQADPGHLAGEVAQPHHVLTLRKLRPALGEGEARGGLRRSPVGADDDRGQRVDHDAGPVLRAHPRHGVVERPVPADEPHVPQVLRAGRSQRGGEGVQRAQGGAEGTVAGVLGGAVRLLGGRHVSLGGGTVTGLVQFDQGVRGPAVSLGPDAVRSVGQRIRLLLVLLHHVPQLDGVVEVQVAVHGLGEQAPPAPGARVVLQGDRRVAVLTGEDDGGVVVAEGVLDGVVGLGVVLEDEAAVFVARADGLGQVGLADPGPGMAVDADGRGGFAQYAVLRRTSGGGPEVGAVARTGQRGRRHRGAGGAGRLLRGPGRAGCAGREAAAVGDVGHGGGQPVHAAHLQAVGRVHRTERDAVGPVPEHQVVGRAAEQVRGQVAAHVGAQGTGLGAYAEQGTFDSVVVQPERDVRVEHEGGFAADGAQRGGGAVEDLAGHERLPGLVRVADGQGAVLGDQQGGVAIGDDSLFQGDQAALGAGGVRRGDPGGGRAGVRVLRQPESADPCEDTLGLSPGLHCVGIGAPRTRRAVDPQGQRGGASATAPCGRGARLPVGRRVLRDGGHADRTLSCRVLRSGGHAGRTLAGRALRGSIRHDRGHADRTLSCRVLPGREPVGRTLAGRTRARTAFRSRVGHGRVPAVPGRERRAVRRRGPGGPGRLRVRVRRRREVRVARCVAVARAAGLGSPASGSATVRAVVVRVRVAGAVAVRVLVVRVPVAGAVVLGGRLVRPRLLLPRPRLLRLRLLGDRVQHGHPARAGGPGRVGRTPLLLVGRRGVLRAVAPQEAEEVGAEAQLREAEPFAVRLPHRRCPVGRLAVEQRARGVDLEGPGGACQRDRRQRGAVGTGEPDGAPGVDRVHVAAAGLHQCPGSRAARQQHRRQGPQRLGALAGQRTEGQADTFPQPPVDLQRHRLREGPAARPRGAVGQGQLDRGQAGVADGFGLHGRQQPRPPGPLHGQLRHVRALTRVEGVDAAGGLRPAVEGAFGPGELQPYRDAGLVGEDAQPVVPVQLHVPQRVGQAHRPHGAGVPAERVVDLVHLADQRVQLVLGGPGGAVLPPGPVPAEDLMRPGGALARLRSRRQVRLHRGDSPVQRLGVGHADQIGAVQGEGDRADAVPPGLAHGAEYRLRQPGQGAAAGRGGPAEQGDEVEGRADRGVECGPVLRAEGRGLGCLLPEAQQLLQFAFVQLEFDTAGDGAALRGRVRVGDEQALVALLGDQGQPDRHLHPPGRRAEPLEVLLTPVALADRVARGRAGDPAEGGLAAVGAREVVVGGGDRDPDGVEARRRPPVVDAGARRRRVQGLPVASGADLPLEPAEDPQLGEPVQPQGQVGPLTGPAGHEQGLAQHDRAPLGLWQEGRELRGVRQLEDGAVDRYPVGPRVDPEQPLPQGVGRRADLLQRHTGDVGVAGQRRQRPGVRGEERTVPGPERGHGVRHLQGDGAPYDAGRRVGAGAQPADGGRDEVVQRPARPHPQDVGRHVQLEAGVGPPGPLVVGVRGLLVGLRGAAAQRAVRGRGHARAAHQGEGAGAVAVAAAEPGAHRHRGVPGGGAGRRRASVPVVLQTGVREELPHLEGSGDGAQRQADDLQAQPGPGEPGGGEVQGHPVRGEQFLGERPRPLAAQQALQCGAQPLKGADVPSPGAPHLGVRAQGPGSHPVHQLRHDGQRRPAGFVVDHLVDRAVAEEPAALTGEVVGQPGPGPVGHGCRRCLDASVGCGLAEPVREGTQDPVVLDGQFAGTVHVPQQVGQLGPGRGEPGQRVGGRGVHRVGRGVRPAHQEGGDGVAAEPDLSPAPGVHHVDELPVGHGQLAAAVGAQRHPLRHPVDHFAVAHRRRPGPGPGGQQLGRFLPQDVECVGGLGAVEVHGPVPQARESDLLGGAGRLRDGGGVPLPPPGGVQAALHGRAAAHHPAEGDAGEGQLDASGVALLVVGLGQPQCDVPRDERLRRGAHEGRGAQLGRHVHGGVLVAHEPGLEDLVGGDAVGEQLGQVRADGERSQQGAKELLGGAARAPRGVGDGRDHRVVQAGGVDVVDHAVLQQPGRSRNGRRLALRPADRVQQDRGLLPGQRDAARRPPVPVRARGAPVQAAQPVAGLVEEGLVVLVEAEHPVVGPAVLLECGQAGEAVAGLGHAGLQHAARAEPAAAEDSVGAPEARGEAGPLAAALREPGGVLADVEVDERVRVGRAPELRLRPGGGPGLDQDGQDPRARDDAERAGRDHQFQEQAVLPDHGLVDAQRPRVEELGEDPLVLELVPQQCVAEVAPAQRCLGIGRNVSAPARRFVDEVVQCAGGVLADGEDARAETAAGGRVRRQPLQALVVRPACAAQLGGLRYGPRGAGRSRRGRTGRAGPGGGGGRGGGGPDGRRGGAVLVGQCLLPDRQAVAERVGHRDPQVALAGYGIRRPPAAAGHGHDRGVRPAHPVAGGLLHPQHLHAETGAADAESDAGGVRAGQFEGDVGSRGKRGGGTRQGEAGRRGLGVAAADTGDRRPDVLYRRLVADRADQDGHAAAFAAHQDGRPGLSVPVVERDQVAGARRLLEVRLEVPELLHQFVTRGAADPQGQALLPQQGDDAVEEFGQPGQTGGEVHRRHLFEQFADPVAVGDDLPRRCGFEVVLRHLDQEPVGLGRLHGDRGVVGSGLLGAGAQGDPPGGPEGHHLRVRLGHGDAALLRVGDRGGAAARGVGLRDAEADPADADAERGGAVDAEGLRGSRVPLHDGAGGDQAVDRLVGVERLRLLGLGEAAQGPVRGFPGVRRAAALRGHGGGVRFVLLGDEGQGPAVVGAGRPGHQQRVRRLQPDAQLDAVQPEDESGTEVAVVEQQGAGQPLQGSWGQPVSPAGGQLLDRAYDLGHGGQPRPGDGEGQRVRVQVADPPDGERGGRVAGRSRFLPGRAGRRHGPLPRGGGRPAGLGAGTGRRRGRHRRVTGVLAPSGGVRFRGDRFRGARFRGARFRGARFRGARLSRRHGPPSGGAVRSRCLLGMPVRRPGVDRAPLAQGPLRQDARPVLRRAEGLVVPGFRRRGRPGRRRRGLRRLRPVACLRRGGLLGCLLPGTGRGGHPRRRFAFRPAFRRGLGHGFGRGLGRGGSGYRGGDPVRGGGGRGRSAVVGGHEAGRPARGGADGVGHGGGTGHRDGTVRGGLGRDGIGRGGIDDGIGHRGRVGRRGHSGARGTVPGHGGARCGRRRRQRFEQPVQVAHEPAVLHPDHAGDAAGDRDDQGAPGAAQVDVHVEGDVAVGGDALPVVLVGPGRARGEPVLAAGAALVGVAVQQRHVVRTAAGLRAAAAVDAPETLLRALVLLVVLAVDAGLLLPLGAELHPRRHQAGTDRAAVHRDGVAVTLPQAGAANGQRLGAGVQVVPRAGGRREVFTVRFPGQPAVGRGPQDLVRVRAGPPGGDGRPAPDRVGGRHVPDVQVLRQSGDRRGGGARRDPARVVPHGAAERRPRRCHRARLLGQVPGHQQPDGAVDDVRLLPVERPRPRQRRGAQAHRPGDGARHERGAPGEQADGFGALVGDAHLDPVPQRMCHLLRAPGAGCGPLVPGAGAVDVEDLPGPGLLHGAAHRVAGREVGTGVALLARVRVVGAAAAGDHTADAGRVAAALAGPLLAHPLVAQGVGDLRAVGAGPGRQHLLHPHPYPHHPSRAGEARQDERRGESAAERGAEPGGQRR
ncbi:pentapeptide repeat-containing protein [Streptomyces sp. NRRL S-31]|uniref:pentapeptide repeat-containing protein n=1 Tax=Streptomyces sp. NRRL S-31 TaxID=1463898 RepID=UPI003463A6B8